MSFIESIKEKARADRKTIILPESEDERTIRAAAQILQEGTADLVLIGDPDVIYADAAKYGVDISGASIINPETSEKLEGYVNLLYELRKAKGMTPEAAREALLKDRTTFGVVMLKAGEGDGLVSGFFVMDVPNCEYGADGTFVFADCGLNQDPNPEQLAAIASDSANSFRALTGKDPYVAFISHSSKGSAKHALVDKVVAAVEAAHAEYPELVCDGELQVDAAIVPSVAASKAPGSPVAGKANVLVFPNLDCGNSAYKLVQRLAKAEAYGPMLQGIAKPVNDLSRGCSAEDIVGVVAITAVQAQMAA